MQADVRAFGAADAHHIILVCNVRCTIIYLEMKEIEVLRGHSKDPDKHCFDGGAEF